MEFTLYTAALTGAEANCRYPEQRKISCAKDLEAAAAFDHVCVAFKNDYRKRENFLSHRMSWSWTAIIRIRKILLNG